MEHIKNYPINLLEVIKARKIVNSYLKPTNLINYPNLSRDIGVDIYIKHENHNPTRSFKIRGGINLMYHLKQNNIKDVITFSTGNHGLSISTSAKMLGLNATVVVPNGNNITKNNMIKDTGAKLIQGGDTFEDASKVVEEIVKQNDAYYAHPADEPHLINGVGSEFLEILEDLCDIDAIILPLGGGSEVAAATTVFKALKPEIEIYAVQAEQSCAAYKSWKEKKILSSSNTSFAGGFATGIGYETPFNIYKNALSDFVLLSEDEIYKGIKLAKEYTNNIVEGAGASTIMAAIKLKDRLKNKKVVLQYSGANPTLEELKISEKY